ncbi:MAG: metal ABC transporter substrate-binding protein [Ornithinimicrobium sp.]|uniref:metal ABC transporter substrate-binding protein n=1 Tax=Ornithinimicrobium sp. TaxID=1977084 RepID=UPI0026DFCEA2|nr:metal ABC transporter substrate-binding protein [Ornithinimicrobium sp.]MDO5739719.1 metal ABC transporter substrate-binding protein [Ornithinimicrobium sp.]
MFWRPLLLLTLPVSLLLAACGTGGSVPAAGPDQVSIAASFYPLEYLTSRIAGDHAVVTTLTGPGVEPHEVELSPRVVGSLSSTDLVVYARGLQPAVDSAVDGQAADHQLDVNTAINLLRLEGDGTEETQAHEGDDGHDHGNVDPHFWLDPTLYQKVGASIERELATLDPAHAADYEANLADLSRDLTALDKDYVEGLASCASRTLVTTHQAFGYLAHRYDLHEISITGLAPDTEPSPGRLAEVTAQIRDQGVTTVFTEPLLSDVVARTVAAETGTGVLILDPVEGLTSSSAGTDYLQIMRANLSSLREGLDCP